MFNLPTKLAATWGALTTAGALSLAVASPAHAYDFTFEVCDAHAGVVTGTPTSCPFADNVAAAYLNGGSPLIAYSPVMNAWYQMICSADYTAHMSYGGTRLAALCQGGNNANVIVF
jgi:hypothetical protein